MIPQPQEELERLAEQAYWRKRLRTERHRVYNQPMDLETQENIRAYWISIYEPREDWNGQSEESHQ